MVATFGKKWQFDGNTDLFINVLVDLESNNALRSLVEVPMPMVVHMTKEQDNRFIFVWLILVCQWQQHDKTQ